MLKALLWKEWREQRAIAFAGVAVALLLPVIVVSVAGAAGPQEILAVADIVPFLFAIVVWPLFAAIAGATANSESATLGSAGFLFSRPVSRTTVWLIKVAIACVALAFVVSVSYYAALRVDVWSGGWGFRFPFSSDPFSWPSDRAVQAMTLGTMYVTFCAAIFLSTFVRRGVAAAMAGLALAVAAQFGGLYLAGHISASSLGDGVEAFIGRYSIGLSLVLLAASLYVFRSAGLTGVGDAARQARRAGVFIGAAMPMLVLVAGFTSTRVSPDTARVQFEAAVPGTDISVVSLRENTFTGSSLWTAAPGRPMRRLTDRMAQVVAVSPDGEWLAYSSRLSALGTRSSRCELRAVRIDGTDERVLEDELAHSRYCYYQGAFGPESRRLVLRVYVSSAPDRLLVTDLDGDEVRLIDVAGLTPRDTWNLMTEWVSRDEVMLYNRYGDPGGYWRINVDTGAIDTVYTPPTDWSSTLLASTTSHLLIRERQRRDRQGNPLEAVPVDESLRLISVVDGTERDNEPLCPDGAWSRRTLARLSPDARDVFYVCREPLPSREEWDFVDLDAVFNHALVRRDLMTGDETTIAELEGNVSSLLPSADATRFVVRLAEARDAPWVRDPSPDRARFEHRYTYRYVLVSDDGAQRSLDIAPEWSALDWFGNDRLVVRGRGSWYASPPIAYLELRARSAELRLVYAGEGDRP